jgi:hypothetical protein
MSKKLKIYVINMLEREDRWKQIQSLYANHFTLIRVNAIHNNEGWKGCFLSHKKCIQLAKHSKMDQIIVMEDDCVPFININDFVKRLNTICEQLNKLKAWHILLGGVYGNMMPRNLKIIQLKNQKCQQIYNGFCTHLIMYNSSCYDFVLQHPINRPIDHIWHGKLTALVPLPFLANQNNGFSNIQHKFVSNVSQKIHNYNNALMKKLPTKEQNNNLNVIKSLNNNNNNMGVVVLQKYNLKPTYTFDL